MPENPPKSTKSPGQAAKWIFRLGIALLVLVVLYLVVVFVGAMLGFWAISSR